MLASPQKSNPALAELERLGFNYYEDAHLPIANLSPDRRVQVRDPDHYAPKANVEQYAIQMLEIPFPPIIVTKNNVIVDGNTRVGAALHNKSKFIHAIVIDYDYGTSDKKNQQLFALAATLNQTSDQRLSVF